VAPLPPFVPPQLATLVKEPPRGEGWIHEVKFDGYRILARLERGEVRLLSRRRNDWTSSFPAIVRAVAKLPAKQALIDGEVAVQTASGRTSFQALQNAFTGETPAGLGYFVFDLLHLDGEDLRGLPVEDRKPRLESLVSAVDPRLQFSGHFAGEGSGLLARAAEMSLEGIVSKRLGEPYRSGRTRAWLKTKCKRRGEFVVAGFTDPDGARGGIGALILGYYAGSTLVFAGKVGSGFTEKASADLQAVLGRAEIPECPFAVRPPTAWIPRGAHWTRPELVVDVEYTEWTNVGGLRHPSFKGLVAGRDPAEITSAPPRNPDDL
jgi:bifunctional non-homologous end joining protein LigD